MDENQLTYVMRAEEAILAAAMATDVSDKYFYQRQAELCIGLDKLRIAQKQANALTSIGVSLKRMDQYITVRTSRG